MLKALTACRGMVTAPHHLAAQAGLSVLRDGGNAVEAMVAAAASIAVVYPHMNSIGGDGFWLICESGKRPFGIDACGRSAALATRTFYTERGYKSIPPRGPLAVNTVPGAVSGWQLALSTVKGKLPLSRLLRDAISYADVGVAVTDSQVKYTNRFLGELAPQPGFAATFLENAQALQPGTVQRFPVLAGTLERLAHKGLGDFYRGDVARSMTADMEQLGSPLRYKDFAEHAPSIVKPLSLELSVGTAFNLPPPTQGLASLLILGIFDRLRHGMRVDTCEHVHAIVEATKQAFLIRNRCISDPDEMNLDPGDFLTDVMISQCAEAVGLSARSWTTSPLKGDTIWMGAADSNGCLVSYIQSVYWEFGSGIVLEGTGITCQNRGSSFSLDSGSHLLLKPQRKPFHTLNPALAQLSDGRTIVYGSMGGDGQPQTQAAVFSRYAMFNQDLQQAVTSPRWLLGRTWGDMSTTLKIESRFGSEMIEALRRAGHEIELIEPFSDLVGHGGALVRHPQGLISGASDPRANGVVASY